MLSASLNGDVATEAPLDLSDVACEDLVVPSHSWTCDIDAEDLHDLTCVEATLTVTVPVHSAEWEVVVEFAGPIHAFTVARGTGANINLYLFPLM